MGVRFSKSWQILTFGLAVACGPAKFQDSNPSSNSKDSIVETASANNSTRSSTSESETTKIDYSGVDLPVVVTGANLTFDNASVHCGQRWETNVWEFVCVLGVQIATESGPMVMAAATRPTALSVNWATPVNGAGTVAEWHCETLLDSLIQRCRAKNPVANEQLKITAACTITQAEMSRSESATIVANNKNDTSIATDPSADVLESLKSRTLVHLDARLASESGPASSGQSTWRNLGDATKPCQNSAGPAGAGSWAGAGSSADPYRYQIGGGSNVNCNFGAALSYLIWVRFSSTQSGTLLSRGATTIDLESGLLAMRYNQIAESSARVTASVSPNNWYHLAMVLDESGAANYFLNGRQIYRLSPTTAETNGGTLYLGTSDSAVASAPSSVAGDIAEFRALNAAIPADIVLSHYESTRNFFRNPTAP